MNRTTRLREACVAGCVILALSTRPGSIAGELDPGVQYRLGPFSAGERGFHQLSRGELAGTKRGLRLSNRQIGRIAIEPDHEVVPLTRGHAGW